VFIVSNQPLPDRHFNVNTEAAREPKNSPIKIAVFSLLLSLAGLTLNPLLAASLSEFESCTIGNDAGLLDAQCATLTVPLNYEDPDGQTIELHVARLVSQSNNPKPDPFTLIAGGPGQSATESFPSVAYAFRHVRAERDVILLDQRGTGLSNKLDCPQDEEQTPSLEFNADEVEALAATCLQALPSDPRFFTTSVAVKDLEALREILNIEQWNMYGVSYGTRVGLHYMRRYPDSVRSMILDAVVPPEVALGPDVAISAQRALIRLFDRCEQKAECNEAFPDLRNGTLSLLERLKSKPVDIKFEDISTGELKELSFTDKHLAVTLRLMSYSAHGTAILPSMLYDAIENDNFSSLARQTQLQIGSVDQALAGGMHNAIVCTEDQPFIEDSFDRAVLEDTFLGADLLDGMQSICSVWQAGVIDDDFKTPLQSDIPTLVLSGADDPITPPSFGEQIMQHLSSAVHIVNENQGHMQAALGCTPLLMAEFINTANASELPLDCLERIRPPAFFVDANGPLP